MEDNKVMKNMEYWKKKNNIPGIEALEQAGLADGRAKSSAFQMAAPVVPNAFEEDENTEVGKELLKEEAKKAIQTAAEQTGGISGITMRKSPLEQKVDVESKTIAGQNITKTEDGFMFSPGEGMEPIPVQDPDNILEIMEDGLVMDNDYQVVEDESGLVVKGISEAEEAPGMPAGAGMGMPEGGVGGPMEMQSPLGQKEGDIYSRFPTPSWMENPQWRAEPKPGRWVEATPAKIYSKPKGKRTEY